MISNNEPVGLNWGILTKHWTVENESFIKVKHTQQEYPESRFLTKIEVILLLYQNNNFNYSFLCEECVAFRRLPRPLKGARVEMTTSQNHTKTDMTFSPCTAVAEWACFIANGVHHR